MESHLAELRRGTVVLACLCLLAEPRYGYALLSTLEDAGFAVDANTLPVKPGYKAVEVQMPPDTRERPDSEQEK